MLILSNGHNFINRLLVKRLDGLMDICEIDSQALMERLQVSPKEFQRRFLSTQGPSVYDFELLLELFGVTFDDFFAERFDPTWIRSCFYKKTFLNPRYKFSAGSKIRTSLPLFQALENEYGPGMIRTLMRTLKISPDVLNNADEVISILLIEDILSFLKQRGFKENDFVRFGSYASRLSIAKPIQMLAKKSKSMGTFLCGITEVANEAYDKNFNYSIKAIKDNQLVVAISPNSERIHDFKSRKFYSKDLIYYRKGVSFAQPYFFKSLPVKVNILKTVYDGANEDVMEVAW